MQVIECSGSPYEIGYKHGSVAASLVAGSIEFYAAFFKESCDLSWKEVLEAAEPFEEAIRRKWPDYHEEMRGLADGASKTLREIVALNVRTEVAFGMMSDGCTSAYCQSENEKALLGQNWDQRDYRQLLKPTGRLFKAPTGLTPDQTQWLPAQAPNLLIATIARPGLPTIKMVTEAGLIGKIGINSAGVGVCFNALRIKGVATERMPAHLALRRALESRTAQEAAGAIEAAGGLAAAAYILVGDTAGAVGLECTAATLVRQPLGEAGTIVHANNLLYPAAHGNPQQDQLWVRDSAARVEQMSTLLQALARPSGQAHVPSAQEYERLFEDEHGWPMSICRAKAGDSKSESLFGIVMDLERRTAFVREGRAVERGKRHVLRFANEDAIDGADSPELARF